MSKEIAPHQPSKHDRLPTKIRVRRALAIVGIALAPFGVYKVGELTVQGFNNARDAILPTQIGCVNEYVQPGDNNIDPVRRGIEELEEQHPNFNVSMTSAINGQADGLGTIHAGDTVEVCGLQGGLFDDTVTVSKNG